MRQWLLQNRCDERNMADKTAKDKSRADANRKDISYGDVDFRWSAEDILAHFKVDMNKVRRSIDLASSATRTQRRIPYDHGNVHLSIE
jgi:hypothetical protein